MHRKRWPRSGYDPHSEGVVFEIRSPALLRSFSKRTDLPLSLAAAAPRNALKKLRVLQPQEVILGLFGEYVKPGEKVWSGGLVRLLEDLNFSPAASRIALSRVVARRLLIPS